MMAVPAPCDCTVVPLLLAGAIDGAADAAMVLGTAVLGAVVLGVNALGTSVARTDGSTVLTTTTIALGANDADETSGAPDGA